MDEKTTILQEVGAAFRDQGMNAAITALVGGTITLLAAVTRMAFTNDAMLARLDREPRPNASVPIVNGPKTATTMPIG